jgi:PleD family two-component response regulator
MEQLSPEPEGRLKVLVCDASAYRSNSFRLARKDQDPFFEVKLLSARAEAEKALKEQSWDLVFLSGYMGNWNAPYELKEDLDQAFRAKRIRGVVVYNPVRHEGREFCKQLAGRGIPVVYYPFDSQKPSSHFKVDWKES